MSSAKIGWSVVENNVKERMIDGSFVHAFLIQRVRKTTKVCNALLFKNCSIKDYKRYVALRTGVLRHVEDNTETDIDTGLTDADCSLIHNSPSKRAQYVAEISERYVFVSEDENTGGKTRTTRKRKARTGQREAKVPSKKPRAGNETRSAKKRDTAETSTKVSVQKKQVTEKRRGKAQNTKPAPSDAKASETCVLGWQDVANRNISRSDNLARTDILSDEEEEKEEDNDDDSFNSTERANHGDSNVIDKAIPHNITNGSSNDTSVDNNIQNYETDCTSSINIDSFSSTDKSVNCGDSSGTDRAINVTCGDAKTFSDSNGIQNYNADMNNIGSDEDHRREDVGMDEGERSSCDQLLSCVTRIRRGTSLTHVANTSSDNMPPDQQGVSEDKSHKIGRFSESSARSSSPLQIVQEMLCCPEEFKKIAEAMILDDFKEIKEDACTSRDSQQAQESSREKEEEEEKKNLLPQVDQADEDACSTSQEDTTVRFTRETNSHNDEKLISLSPEQSPLKTKHPKLCRNLSNAFEELDGKETANFSDQEMKKLPDSDQTDRNADLTIRDEVRLVKAEKSPRKESPTKAEHFQVNSLGEEEDNREEAKFFAEEKEENSLKENQSDTSKRKIPCSGRSPEDDEHTKVSDDVSRDDEDGNCRELSEREDDSCDSSANDEEPDTADHSEMDRAKTEESPDEEGKKLFEEESEDESPSSVSTEATTPDVKSEVTAKEQLLPRVMRTEVINQKYKIIEKRDDAVNGAINGYGFLKNKHIASPTDVGDRNVFDEDATSGTSDHHDDKYCISSRARKRREQARSLNLVVSSDSSDSENRAKCDSDESVARRRVTNTVRGVDRNRRTECAELETSLSRVSESDAFCNSGECVNNGFLLNKGIVRDVGNRCENRTSDIGAAETGKSKHEKNVDTSTNRPRNIQELIENQKLVTETMPPTLTLEDISDEEEAYILNVPTRLLKCNLKNELLTLDEDTINFGKNKYRIVDKQVNTISWVFATGKKRNPYRIVNLNNVNTITILDNVTHYSETPDSRIFASSETDVSNTERKGTLSNIKLLEPQ